MFLTISQLLSISILVLFVGFISAQVVDSQESDKNRDDALQDINNRRHSIKYVMNVLNRLDHNLENMERQQISKNFIKVGKDGCITGIPGADCDHDIGPPVTESHRNPGKRSVKCLMFGANCPDSDENIN
ncbi:uncharacterized protein LOC128963490 isoform X1 [Oppia nitens]|uniref:uncharacterized protein LOC128963490 isoform X1 n=1 Tax=Oppia nitens TaxID=1686743 RepID=UPI0023DBCC11|nr:uncharacterized protein LOC128963490 isoform X1 [Oppia nitens]